MALQKPIILRIILIVVVFLVLVITLVGHFWSDWTQEDHGVAQYNRLLGLPAARSGKNFKTCPEAHYFFRRNERDRDYHMPTPYDCPDIVMERFYLAWLFFCLFGAIGSVLLVHFNKNNNKWLRLVEFILHVLLGFVLLIGVITFLVSTLQAKDVLDDKNKWVRKQNEYIKELMEYAAQHNKREEKIEEFREYDEYYQWIIKLLASIFGLAVVGFHGILAFLIGRPLFQELKQGGGGKAEEGAASQSAEEASPSKQEAEAKESTKAVPAPAEQKA